MKKVIISIIVLIISLVAFSCQQSESDAWKNIVDRVVEKHAIENGPGGVVAIARGNQIVYSKSFGYADIANKIPNTSNTLFDIASCAKQFTAASILMLVEREIIDLDMAIQYYFPEFVIKEPIPVRSLLTHSSGLHDYSEMLLLARGRDEVSTYTKEEVLTTIYQQTSLSFLPLTDENYSNSNFVILAELVERVSNMSFEDFVTRNILEPLEITTSEIQFLGARKIDSVHLAIGYPYRPEETTEFVDEHFVKNPNSSGLEEDHILGSSGIKANVHGLVKWMGNYKSGNIGNQSLMELLLKRDTLTNGSLTSFARGIKSGTVPDGFTWIEHTGRNNFTSVMLWWPDFDISMVALINTQEIWAQSITNAFCMDILASLPHPDKLFMEKQENLEVESHHNSVTTVSKKPTINLSKRAMENFVGIYPAEAPVGNRRPPSGGVGVNEIILEDGHLVGIRYDGSKFELYPVSPAILAVDGSPIEFHFMGLGAKNTGFHIIDLQEDKSSIEMVYRITEPTANRLKQFCGNYICPTLINSIPIEITFENDKLYMIWGINKNRAELHYLEDGRLTTFKEGPIAAMQCNLVVKRDVKGNLLGFNYEGHRIWNLPFEKQNI